MVSCWPARLFSQHIGSVTGYSWILGKQIIILSPAASIGAAFRGTCPSAQESSGDPVRSRAAAAASYCTRCQHSMLGSTAAHASSWQLLPEQHIQWQLGRVHGMQSLLQKFSWMLQLQAHPTAAAAALQLRCLHVSPNLSRMVDIEVTEEGFRTRAEDDEHEVYLDEDESEEDLDSEWVDGGSMVTTTHHDSDEDLYDVEFDEAWEEEEDVDDLSAQDVSDDERR